MAAFESPPPRKTHRHGTPRQASTPPKQRKLAGTRLASGTYNAPATKSTTPANAMDVQEVGHYDRDRPFRERETVFAKTEELVVGLYGNLPVEVRHVLRSADFITESYVGGIDSTSGYTLVASVRTYHPTTTFQAPYFALVPSRARAVEPGLILVSPTGVARFWPSISSGLSGGGAFESVQIPLDVAEDEYVSLLTRIDQPAGAYGYLAATSTGRIFRLVITSQAGKSTLTARLFSPQPSSSSLSLTRLFGIGWSAPTPAPRPEPGNVVALVSSGSVIFALVEMRIQKWALSSEELIRETDVGDIIKEAITSGVGVEDLESIDLVVESENTLVLLVSYASSTMDAGAMVLDQYEYGPHRDGWRVDRVSVVPYVANAASPPAHPHLSLLAGGAVVAVLFGEVVVLCARDTPYHERLVLKSSTDRLLGLAALPSVFSVDYGDADSSVDMDGGETREEAQVLLMTSGLMLKARMDVDKVKKFRLESLPNLLKATLKQAILYSPIPSNPLQFILPAHHSDPEIVRPNHDLTAQLTARKERLSWLIGFINDNGALGKMSQRSRQRLATDAEKLYACHQLWVRLNEHIDSGAAHSLIIDTIHAFTAAHPSSAPPSQLDTSSTPERKPAQDVVRDFFKHRVPDLGRLLVFMVEYLGQLGSMGAGGIGALKEIGGAVVATLQAALSYRAYNLGVYGVDLPMIKPWTSRPTVIDAALKLVDAASKVATDSGPSSSAGAKDVVNMLPELATLLFSCVQERLDWLGSPMAADEPGSQRDRMELEDRFSQLRPEILETLPSLLLRPTPYPPSANPHASLIKDYLERYNHAFGREVVRWCIEHGEARVLFAEEDVWGPYMDDVFADGVNGKKQQQESGAMDVDTHEQDEFNAIAWVNDMGRSRFGDASRRLIKVSKGATEVGQKHFMLSLGKLAQLAHLQEGGALDGTLLEAFHDGLDFIAVQENLFKDFQTALASLRGKQKQNQDAQVEAIIRTKASRLKESERKGLISIFKNDVRRILQRKTLSVEDMVDVLTLKDNEETLGDYATALQLLLREEDVPDVRRISAFRRVWCRVYNHDDWDAIRQTANITDAQLAARFRGTALYHTLQAILPVIKSTQQNTPLPEGFDLDPNQCLPVPLMPETSSRFPGMPVEMVGELARDFRAESTNVEQMRLDDVYFRVREVALEDLGYEAR
ncbi:hypothetical protein EDD15DRAFT_2212668 [Pisolithus albus]|nr:hypothetical protein EDD15DRAFT_2212668 [Pisolithus albus]